MTILALDPSTKKTGYAIFQDNSLIKYGTISAKETFPLFKRIDIMIESLTEILNNYEIKTVYIEDVIPDDVHHNQKVFKALTYLQGFILSLLEKHNVPVIFYTSSEWRKKCGIKTGRGVKRESLKAKDIQFVKDNYQIEVDDDTADAICIGDAAIGHDIGFELR